MELSPDNEIVNDTLAENLFQLSTFLSDDAKPGEKIDLLREVVFYNPEHIKAHEQISNAYHETLNGTKVISHILISQRFLVEKNDETTCRVL